MVPIVIPETLITPFKYWHGSVQTGMTYQNELYIQVSNYSLERRLDAYEEGFRLGANGGQVCITVTSAGYTLWQSLRSLSVTDGAQLGNRNPHQPQASSHDNRIQSKPLWSSSSDAEAPPAPQAAIALR